MREEPPLPRHFTAPARSARPSQNCMAPTASQTILRAGSIIATEQSRSMEGLASVLRSMRRKRISSGRIDMQGHSQAQVGLRQGSESAFPKTEYDARVARARALLTKTGIDVMIVT